MVLACSGEGTTSACVHETLALLRIRVEEDNEWNKSINGKDVAYPEMREAVVGVIDAYDTLLDRVESAHAEHDDEVAHDHAI